jgi:hypothetical protein
VIGITWLAPVIDRGRITWPVPCEWIRDTWEGPGEALCTFRARVDFRGKKLCMRHAQLAALIELAGPRPPFATADSLVDVARIEQTR